MSRAERRAERIRLEVPIEQVLVSYGYGIQVGGDREQQFRCDLHGDGQDGKPSARCYPNSNSWFCWACNRSRDAIDTVREKEGKGFSEALESIERQFHLPPLPWEDSDRGPVDPFSGMFDPPVHTFEVEAARVGRLVDSMCQERSLGLPIVLSLVEEYDRLASLSAVEESGIDSLDEMVGLRYKILGILRGS